MKIKIQKTILVYIRTVLSIFFTGCMACISGLGQGQSAFINEGLELYYSFSGNDNFYAAKDLVYIDGPNSSTKGVFLNGLTAYIQTHLTQAFINQSKKLTVSVWVKGDPTKQRIDNWGAALFDAGHGLVNTSGMEGQPFGLWLLPQFKENALYWSAYLSDPAGKFRRVYGVLDSATWNYVTYVFDLNSTPRRADIYVKGVKVDSVVPQFDTFRMLGSRVNIGLINTWLDQDNIKDGFWGTSPVSLASYRVYSKSLSDAEVKALYEFESKQSGPNTANALATVVNGFLVGATILNGGSGYTNNPAVTIIGGGGSGATAIATQVNGVVNAIKITNPGSGYTSTPTIKIAPPPFPPKKSTAISEVVNGFVVGIKVTDAGFGYETPPTVVLSGGGGTGASAVATVSNGVVVGITIVNPGTGYTSAPNVRIASPPFSPELSIDVSRVNVNIKVVLGSKYQIESSKDMATWTPTGPPFVAEDENLVQEFQVNSSGQYFRITQVP